MINKIFVNLLEFWTVYLGSGVIVPPPPEIFGRIWKLAKYFVANSAMDGFKFNFNLSLKFPLQLNVFSHIEIMLFCFHIRWVNYSMGILGVITPDFQIWCLIASKTLLICLWNLIFDVKKVGNIRKSEIFQMTKNMHGILWHCQEIFVQIT